MTEKKIEFDEYCDSIRIATAIYLKTGPTLGHWSLSWSTLHRIALQYGTDGSARIAHGLTPPNAVTVFIQLTKLPEAVSLDGHMTKWHDVAVFPSETHFTFVSDQHLSWLAIAIPVDVHGASGLPELERSGHQLVGKSLITLSSAAAERLIDIAKRIRGDLAKPSEPDYIAAAENDLLAELDNALTQIDSKVVLPSDYNKSAERIIYKALEYVRARPWEPITVEELVAATKVEYRTLLRAFHRYLNIGPKHYLKLRQLDLVRRTLREQHLAEESVTSIMAKHGVTEFGRFAVEYKHLFHETPSETFRRSQENSHGHLKRIINGISKEGGRGETSAP